MKQQTKSKQQISTFLVNLIKILEDAECEELVSWIETQNGFKITQVHEFTEKVLPKYFKHQNFSSFVRQLNLYGFTKVRGLEHDHVYLNPNFKRGNKKSMRKIQRRVHNLTDEPPQKVKTEGKKKQARYETEKHLEEIKGHQLTLQERFKETLSNNLKIFQNNSKVIQNLNKKDHREQEFIESLFSIFKINNKKCQNSPTASSPYGTNNKISEQLSKFKQDSNIQTENTLNKNQDYVELKQFQEFEDLEDIIRSD